MYIFSFCATYLWYLKIEIIDEDRLYCCSQNISEKYNEGAVTQNTTLVGVEDVSGQIQKQPHAEWPEDAAQHKTSGG